MKKFNKRIYNGPRELLSDLRYIFKNSSDLRKIMKGNIISHEFRERLMLAVTAVNGCRYCSYYHAKLALDSGISGDELKSLLSGEFKNSPDEESEALLFAQHWAEQNGSIEEKYTKKILSTYGEKISAAILLTLRTIRLGNLTGNTFDYFLYRLTFGRFGLPTVKINS